MPAVLSPSVEGKVRRAIKEKLALCKLSISKASMTT